MIERDGNRLRVRGGLTLATVTALAETGKTHLGDGGATIVDLAAVTEVDSAALSLLFEWRRAAQRSHGRLTFENLPASLQSLAALYGVTDLLAHDF